MQNLLSNPMVQSNGTISFHVPGLGLSKNAFEGMTSSLGTIGKTKTSLLGVKKLSYRVETFTLVEDSDCFTFLG